MPPRTVPAERRAISAGTVSRTPLGVVRSAISDGGGHPDEGLPVRTLALRCGVWDPGTAVRPNGGGSVDTETTIDESVEAAQLNDRVRVRKLCLERCDEITCGEYEFPEGIRRAHWVAIVVVTLAAGAFAWAGFLL